MEPEQLARDHGSSPQSSSAAGTTPTDEHLQLDTDIAERQAQLARLWGQRRVLPIVAVVVIVLLAIAASALGLAVPSRLDIDGIKEWIFKISAYPPFAVTLGLSVMAMCAYLVRSTITEISLAADIELLQAKRRIATRLPIGTQPPAAHEQQSPSYFDSLVKINVDNLAEYYSLVKVHTNNSFRASLLAGAIGFGLILIGVIAGFGGADTATPAKIAAVSGVVTEFISGVFFYLYNRTVRQLKEYHDSLLSVQNVLLSFKLVNDTEDTAAKRDMTAQMCRFLLARVSFPVNSSDTEISPKRGGRKSAKKQPSDNSGVAFPGTAQ